MCLPVSRSPFSLRSFSLLTHRFSTVSSRRSNDVQMNPLSSTAVRSRRPRSSIMSVVVRSRVFPRRKATTAQKSIDGHRPPVHTRASTRPKHAHIYYIVCLFYFFVFVSFYFAFHFYREKRDFPIEKSTSRDDRQRAAREES